MNIQPRRQIFDCDAAVVVAYMPMGKATRPKLQFIPIPGTGVPKAIDLIIDGEKGLLALRAAVDYALNKGLERPESAPLPKVVRVVVDPPALRAPLAESFPVNGN